MTYFDDLAIHFDKFYDIDYRGNKRFVIDINFCGSKIMLYFATAKVVSLYFLSRYFLSSCLSVSIFPLVTIPIVPVSNKITVTVAR